MGALHGGEVDGEGSLGEVLEGVLRDIQRFRRDDEACEEESGQE
ncbi:MAG: hypothetical protein ACI8QS_003067, partial [Planctomycetota bacterium]